MLERIEKIQGVGLLHDANGKSRTCHKATLIYADNGRGKSTLATIMRSVSNGDASLITARKTVDGIIPTKVVLQFGSGHKVTFDGETWSEQRPEVLVFDWDFIERNVHSGGSVTTDHRKNLLEFALGEPSVAARADVERATDAAKTASDKVRNLTAQLSGHHEGITLTQFEKLPLIADVDAKIIEIQKRTIASSNVATIIAKPIPSIVTEPSFDVNGLFSTLGNSIEDIHEDAEKIVRRHIEALGKKDAEKWLSQGRQFDDSKACPYCGHDTIDNDLIRAYRTHFNIAYSDLKEKIEAIYIATQSATSVKIIDVFTQSIATAIAQAAAWTDHVQIQPIQFDVEASRAALVELHTLVLDLCQKKLSSPAEPVGSTAELKQAIALWDKVVAPMRTANSTIKEIIDTINSYRGQLASDNLLQLQQLGKQLQVAKRRYDPIVIDLIGQLTGARADANAAEITKKAARENLDTLMKATLDKYEKTINSLLKNFGASFSIKGMGANFRGAAPRSEYGLLLRGKDVALEGGPPSFSTALSDGDKRTLAFAFFIASTLADTNLSSRIVIIDDPMCSLDLNRRHYTRTVLKKIYSGAAQLIVLAHDPYFLRDLRDTLRKEDKAVPVALFQLAAAASNYTDFAHLDIDKECESVYSQHHRLMNEFSSGINHDHRTVAKAIRPMLEGYLHRRFPGLLPKDHLFGQIVVCIRDSDSASPLRHAKNLVDELNEINEYAGQFHHDTNPDGADSVAITGLELKTYVDRALSLVHKGIA